jgi:hypothetical protein
MKRLLTIMAILATMMIAPIADSAYAQQPDLFVSIVSVADDSALCEGGPSVCKSRRYLMVVILNPTTTTYERATVTCAISDKTGSLIETKTQQIEGPIFPRKTNEGGQPRNAPSLVDRAMADAVAMVQFSRSFPAPTKNEKGQMESQMDVKCKAMGEGSVKDAVPPSAASPSEEETSLTGKRLTSFNILGKSYVAYIGVKRCYEAREGYQSVYVNDVEMMRAREAIIVIERAFDTDKQRKDVLWQQANGIVGSRMASIHFDYLRFDSAAGFCRGFYLELQKLLALASPVGVPATPKDF